MHKRTKTIIEAWAPPALLQLVRRRTGTRWYGNYSTWQEAAKASSGYQSKEVIRRVKEATLKVKTGLAQYERDGVTFDRIQYSWPLLSGLMWVAAQREGNLNILDFGGSLGSTYFQNRKFLLALPRVSWSIVEQPHFVDEGKKHFENETLMFYKDMESCVRQRSPHCILFSGVLQYLENPYALLERVKALSFPFILIDRTGFIGGGKDRLTIQRVPPTIYPASYPCWFFSRQKFLSNLHEEYHLIAEFDALAGVMSLGRGRVGIDKGFIFGRRSRS